MSVIWKLVRRVVRTSADRGKTHRAVRVAQWYASRSPANPYAWTTLDFALMRDGVDLGEREIASRRGFDATNGEPMVGLNLYGILVMEEKNEASPLLHKLAETHPDEPGVQGALAAEAISKGDLRSAAQYQEHALLSISRRTEIEQVLGIYENLLPLGQRERAIELLEVLVKSQPRNATPYVMLAQLVESASPERATALIQEAREVWGWRPNFDEWLRSLRYLDYDSAEEQPESPTE